MAQLRQDHQQFLDRNCIILAVGPDGPNAFQRYWKNENMPFPGLSDVGNVVSRQYSQEINILKYGRMPAMFIIDSSGVIRYAHYAKSMSDIPENESILKLIDKINSVE